MQTERYRKHLKKAVNLLFFAELEIFDDIVDTAFSGIYSDIAEVHDNKEILFMEEAYFEDTNDANVVILMDIMKRIRTAKVKMMNLNALDYDELASDP